MLTNAGSVLFSRFCAFFILFLVLCLCLEFPTAHSLAETFTEANISWNTESEKDELFQVMNLNLRYILNDWWNAEKDMVYASTTNADTADRQLTEERKLAIRNSAEMFVNWREVDDLSILYLSREQAENGIRPTAHVIYCISLALHHGYYDEEIVGVSKADAEAMCIKLISSVTGEHSSNHPDSPDKHWGDSWQSPLWAENIGLGAWLLWDSLDPAVREKVERMILDEAHSLMYDYEIPYYMAPDGTILYPGDTKGEEIAWDTKLLALACFMFPESQERPGWEDKLERMLVASTAMPEDVGSDRLVDGRKVGELINGSNVNEDGTVVNHDRYHIDYMATIFEELGDTIVLYKLTGKPVPEAALFNLDKIYRALIEVDLGKYDAASSGQYFYHRDENGLPSGSVEMPGSNDWGKAGYAIYYLCDVMADIFELDKDIDARFKGHIWEELHFEKMLAQVLRETDGSITGQFFQPGENFFISIEPFMMHNLAEVYVLKYVL